MRWIEQALGALAGDQQRPGLAALASRSPWHPAAVALLLVLAVAVVAALGKDRLDVADEIDRAVRGRRQLGAASARLCRQGTRAAAPADHNKIANASDTQRIADTPSTARTASTGIRMPRRCHSIAPDAGALNANAARSMLLPSEMGVTCSRLAGSRRPAVVIARRPRRRLSISSMYCRSRSTSSVTSLQLEHVLDALEQLGLVDRLGEEVVGAGLARPARCRPARSAR